MKCSQLIWAESSSAGLCFIPMIGSSDHRESFLRTSFPNQIINKHAAPIWPRQAVSDRCPANSCDTPTHCFFIPQLVHVNNAQFASPKSHQPRQMSHQQEHSDSCPTTLLLLLSCHKHYYRNKYLSTIITTKYAITKDIDWLYSQIQYLQGIFSSQPNQTSHYSSKRRAGINTPFFSCLQEYLHLPVVYGIVYIFLPVPYGKEWKIHRCTIPTVFR